MSEKLWQMAVAEFGSITGYLLWEKSRQTRILAIKRGGGDRPREHCSCFLYPGSNYMHYSLMEKLKLPYINSHLLYTSVVYCRGRCVCSCMVVLFITTYSISGYHHQS